MKTETRETKPTPKTCQRQHQNKSTPTPKQVAMTTTPNILRKCREKEMTSHHKAWKRKEKYTWISYKKSKTSDPQFSYSMSKEENLALTFSSSNARRAILIIDPELPCTSYSCWSRNKAHNHGQCTRRHGINPRWMMVYWIQHASSYHRAARWKSGKKSLGKYRESDGHRIEQRHQQQQTFG